MISRERPRTNANDLPLRARRFIDCFRDIERFWEATSVQKHQAIANLEARVFDGAHEPVMGPGASEGQHMGAGFQDAENFRPYRGIGYSPVPVFAHKLQAVGRVGDAAMEFMGLQGGQDFAAVGMVDTHSGVLVIRLQFDFFSLISIRNRRNSPTARAISFWPVCGLILDGTRRAPGGLPCCWPGC